MSRKKEDFVRDWLAGRGSREDVEKEIQETVFILSPKHAPHPRKNIDQIFSRLRGGPLSLLPQEDVHEDVEMLFSGAQTSNAIPRGDIASVLNGLKEGPLSVDKEQNHVREDSKESADVIPFRKSWSVWGTVFAAAAVLLLLVQPVVHNPMMMFSQEQNKTESKPMVSKEYEVESVQEEESKENIITFPPSVHKKNTRSTQPKKKEKTKINPTSPRITVPKKRSFRQEEVVSEKKRAQADYFLNEMEDEESISLEDTKKIEQSQEIEKVEKRMEVLEAAPTPATETIAARSQKDENAKDVLSILREEALRGKKIPRHPPFENLNQEALISITQDADIQRMYWAAYELAIRFPQERDHIESLLRLKSTPSVEQKYLFVLLGDIYRSEGILQKSEQAYLQALKIRAK